MKIEWQDLPLLGYGYFAKVVFKCWTKNIANWSGCWYVASNIWYFFLMRNDRVLVEKMNVLFKLLAFMKRRGKNHPPPPPSTPSGQGSSVYYVSKRAGQVVSKNVCFHRRSLLYLYYIITQWLGDKMSNDVMYGRSHRQARQLYVPCTYFFVSHCLTETCTVK